MSDLLQQIAEATRRELSGDPEPLAQLEERARAAADRHAPHRFRDALIVGGAAPRLIAEIKAASPSAGPIAPDPDVEQIARAYRAGGAAAISIVAEPRFFSGSLDWIERASTASRLPILMKHFVTEPRLALRGIAAGADGILLLASLLSESQMRELLSLIGESGRDALVEVHDEAELETAVAAGASIIGVNNRDLRTFEVDLSTAERLVPRIPSAALRVAESGIRSAADAGRMATAGFDAILVGEHLLRSSDREAAARELTGGPAIKICGITRPVDALEAAAAGADFIGLVFAAGSTRRVGEERAREIAAAVRKQGSRARIVGVFRDQPLEEIRSLASSVGLDMVQLHGSEHPAMIAGAGVPVIRAVGVNGKRPDFSDGDPAWFLFDTAASAGKGVAFDWSLLDGIERKNRFFLAGGLTPDNVAEAVRRVRPDALDVSTGVEESPGIKSPAKVRRFIEEARRK